MVESTDDVLTLLRLLFLFLRSLLRLVSITGVKGFDGENVQHRRPCPLRSVSCQRQPWPHKEYAASQKVPSTSLPKACRPRLHIVSTNTREVIERDELTKLDARVVLADLLALLIGKEHVGGKTTLGRVWVYGWLAI